MADFRSRATKGVKNKGSKVNTFVLAGLKMFIVLDLLSCAQSCKTLKPVLGRGGHEKLGLQGRGDHDIERLVTYETTSKIKKISPGAVRLELSLTSLAGDNEASRRKTKEDIPEPIVLGNPLTGTGADDSMIAPGVQ